MSPSLVWISTGWYWSAMIFDGNRIDSMISGRLRVAAIVERSGPISFPIVPNLWQFEQIFSKMGLPRALFPPEAAMSVAWRAARSGGACAPEIEIALPRTTAAIIGVSMRIVSKVYLVVLALVLAAGSAAAQTKAAPKGPVRTVVITAGDDMKFAPTEIAAKPGEVIKIRLMATGTMPAAVMRHNVVVLKAGTNQIDFAEAAATSPATDYIPPAMKSAILAQTPLIPNGQSAEVTFTVPAKAGNYPYLCTFPGHMAAGARGKIVVK
ncbi:MAG: hypothetical protein EPO35_00770 [Acidobacteria bacterium]|nr:MAG: hypothetical protein EPO35_00770 [Acidobacteriota bacterium]